MRSLQKPTLEISAKDIFELCASSITDDILRSNLLSNSCHVEDDTTTFVNSAPDTLHEMEKKPKLSNGITNKQMRKIYSEKFAALNSPGRKYYDILLSAPIRSICPICGDRTVKNLDHYMPKAIYSTLVVTPENLIPTCRDCNFEKHTYEIKKPEDVPLHPYFDDINDDAWLFTTLQTGQVALYEVRCPAGWSPILKERVKNHLFIYELDKFYASKAAQEIADEILYWKQIYQESGQTDLLKHFEKNLNSLENSHLNSWKAALYRGLVNQFNEVIRWLT